MRPAGALGRVGRELVEVEPAEHSQIVVSDQAERGALLHEGGRLVRAGPIADEVAQAPDRIGRFLVDRFEHRFERV